jgi:DNA-binding transcriptional LysR family regulator
MELRHLKYFLAVAEELNFRRAAARLYITQPPLTRQIQELEHELGVRLFERAGKHIRLTEAGEFLQKESRLLLEKADEIKRQAMAVQESGESRLRLGFIESAVQSFLPDALAALRAEAPDLSLDLFQMPSERQVMAILHGRLDAGIMRFWGKVEELEYKSILDESLYALCSRRLVGEAVPVTVADLADLPFLSFSHTTAPGLVDRIDEVFFLNGMRPRVAFSGGHVATIEKLVLAGLGWSILPGYTIEHLLGSDSLISVKIEGLSSSIVIGVAWRKGKTTRPVQLLIDSIGVFEDR